MESTEIRDGGVTVRPMRESDAEAVAELARQLGYARTSEEVRRWIAELAGREEEQAGFVACVGDEVVGWIEASVERRLQSERVVLIGGLVVKDGVRGRGVGRLLCERVEGWARERGVGKVRVTSRSSREGAHRFYLRDGYVQTKTSLVFEKRLES